MQWKRRRKSEIVAAMVRICARRRRWNFVQAKWQRKEKSLFFCLPHVVLHGIFVIFIFQEKSDIFSRYCFLVGGQIVVVLYFFCRNFLGE
jgi:arginine exporter protein ArgO